MRGWTGQKALRGREGGDRERVGGDAKAESYYPFPKPAPLQGWASCVLTSTATSAEPVTISRGAVLRRESCVCCRGGDDAQELESSIGDFRRGAPCVS